MSMAVYLRVSTQLQAQAQTSEQQLERWRAHIQQTGGTLLDKHIFRDDGFSGASLNRPGLDALRDQVKAGEVERVLITAPDRLARNYVHQMVLLEELQRAGCIVEFLDRPMSDDPHDQLLLQIRGAVAEYERTLIGERMRRGRQRKLQAGALLPWTHVPYGYRVNPDRPRDPAGVLRDEAEAAVIQEMFVWYLGEDASLAGLTRHLQALGLPSPRGLRRWNQATVRGILTNPAYTGQVYLGRTQLRAPRVRRSATHSIGRPAYGRTATPSETWIPVAAIPALVSQPVYDQVQAKLALNQQFARRNNTAHDYLLRALVSCGACNLACTGRGRSQYRYYVCRGKAPPSQSCRDERCTARLFPAGQLDDLVWQDLCEVVTHPELIAHALERAHGGHWLPQELQARRETLRKGRVQLRLQLERLSEAYLHGIIPLAEYERRRRELEQKDEALDGQARQLEAQVDRQSELAGLVASVEAFCGRVQASLAQATFEQKRQLVELLIDRVVVTNDEVEIRYVIPTSPASEQVRFCHLRKDYFEAPAQDEPLEDLFGLEVEISREQGLGLELPLGIADQDPTDRQRRRPANQRLGSAGPGLGRDVLEKSTPTSFIVIRPNLPQSVRPMPDLHALETDLRTSLPPELAVLAPDLARTLQTVALGQVSVEQARFLLGQPTTLAILREMLATPGAASPAAITVGDIYNSHGVAIGPNARVVYQGPGYPRPDYRTEIANRLAHLQQTFVGRGDLLTDLTAAPRAGYTVLMAPAGYGKSAVAAQLIARHDRGEWPGTLCFVFLRQETGENTPVFFLQRLNAQLLTVLGLEGGVPGDLEALRAQFSALWARLFETVPGPVAILVDGLDEMAPGPVSVATMLPDRLAPNVQILVTSRPSPDPRDAVPAGHPLLAGRFRTLAGFTTADLVDLLTRLGASSATSLALAPGILALTRGEPLLARFVAEESAAAGAIPSSLVDDAPTGVRAYFARQVDQLIAVGDSALTRDVLGTLCVARGGLSRRDLAEVIGAEPLDVGKVLEPARRFFLGQERLELMHLELREALQDEFSPKHLRVCTDRVLAWCAAQAQAGWPARTPRYALEHYAHHLDAAGDRAARLALVTDPAFRAAQWQGLGDIGRTLEDVRAALVDALDADDVVGVVACAAAYRETLRHGQVGEAVFAALDSGDPPQALQRAAICGNDAEWAQVLWAYLAWEYATRGQVAEVQRALGGLGRAPSPPLDSLVDALLVATARSLADDATPVIDGQAGRTAADWLTSWGRANGEGLLAAYPEASADDRAGLIATVDDLQPMADHLIQQIESDARSGMYEAVAYIETGNEEESLRIRDLRARLATVTALPEGRVLVERLLRATLFNPYPFYRDQAVATLGVAALAAPQDSEARAWLRRQLRAMLGMALTGEGVTFTFELPAQLLAFKPAPSSAVGELEGVLGRGRYLVDRWGSHLRARLADVGALARLGEVGSTAAHGGLAEALQRPVGYAGFAVLTFLAIVDLCRELGLDPQSLTSRRDGLDQPVLEAALSSAGAVRDPDFRARRTLLVHLYRTQWLSAPPPRPTELAERLAALPERDIRLAYLAHLSAVWSESGTPDREGLKAVVPFALSDATTLDVVLARWVGARPLRPTPAEVEAMAVACARDLATGRPWDYSARVAPDEPNVVP